MTRPAGQEKPATLFRVVGVSGVAGPPGGGDAAGLTSGWSG
ncbi:hypothetical protein [Paractinoplanes ovalisporus]|nr:hypothetical protein [Actinoplanes ovalisporus]